jgi:acetoin utilization protein AcuB
MDFTAPVSKWMTTKMVTVVPGDSVSVVKDIFDQQRIHHIPVVKYRTLVGLISKSDFLHFLRGMETTPYDKLVEKSRLEHYKAEDIMTTGLATLEPNERLNVALQLFSENLFHAIPIVEKEELVGILTTFDIIRALVEEDNKRIKST